MSNSQELEKRIIALEKENQSLRNKLLFQDIFEEILNSSPDNIFVLDVCPNNKFKILTVNRTLAKVLGLDISQIDGKFLDDILTKENIDLITQNFLRCSITKECTFYEEVAYLSDRELHYSTSLIPSFNDKGEVVRIIGISRDITESKMAEKALIVSEQNLKHINTTKDKLFSIIGHDLRSPFISILGFSELLRENFKNYSSEKNEQYIAQICSSAKNTLSLLENLLTWAMSQTGRINFEPKTLSLQSIVNESIKTIESNARIKSISIRANINENDLVYADENMLNIILGNLLTNAIKFTHKDGSVSISSKDETSCITVIIEDNGIGMSSDTLEKLFKLNTNYTSRGTANEKGSGLGLMLCKDFIEKNGGKLWVESKLGEGSKFYFTIPKMQ